MKASELKSLNDRDFIVRCWGSDVLAVIDKQETRKMSMDDFLSHCTACGGNWGGMLLTGINKFWPDVWEAIPDDMGVFAWNCLCITIRLLGVCTE